MKVKPVQGRIVRDPRTMAILPQEGREVLALGVPEFDRSRRGRRRGAQGRHTDPPQGGRRNPKGPDSNGTSIHKALTAQGNANTDRFGGLYVLRSPWTSYVRS